MEFSGTPKKYLRYAIISSIVLNLYLFLGLSAILYWHDGSTWLFSAKPIAITIGFAALFARISYRWIMRLDAQFGTGRGWSLKSRTLKLPERAIRRK